ncbi:MAG: hypothetical protein ABIH67_01555 [Candidatus Uhrbacteria bacterium]
MRTFSLLIATTLTLVLALPALAQDSQDRKRRDHLVISIGEGGQLEQMQVVLPAATPRQVQRTTAPMLAYMACMDNGGSAQHCSSRADSTPTRSSIEVQTSPAYGYYPGVPGYSPGYYPDTSINNPFNIQYGYSRTEEELYQQYEYSQAQREEMDRVRARAIEDAQVDILREVVSGQAVLEERVQATDGRVARAEQRLDNTDQRLETVADQTAAELAAAQSRLGQITAGALVEQQIQMQRIEERQRELEKKEAQR